MLQINQQQCLTRNRISSVGRAKYIGTREKLVLEPEFLNSGSLKKNFRPNNRYRQNNKTHINNQRVTLKLWNLYIVTIPYTRPLHHQAYFKILKECTFHHIAPSKSHQNANLEKFPYSTKTHNHGKKIKNIRNQIQHEQYFASYEFNKTHKVDELPILLKIENPNFSKDKSFQYIVSFLHPLNKLYRYTSRDSIALKFINRIYYLDQKIRKLYAFYENTLITTQSFPSQLVFFDFIICEIIHGIKRVLDIITISTYLEFTKLPNFLDIDNQIPCDGIRFLLTSKREETNIEIFKKTLFDQYEDLYRTINDIHNAYKHDILCESMSLEICKEPLVNISKFQNQNKNLKNIKRYSIELRKIIFACNDLFNFILKNKDADAAPKFRLIKTTSTQLINTDYFL